MSILSPRHGWILRKDDGVSCTCTPTNKRHLFGWDCVSAVSVADFMRQHPEIRTLANARRLCWLAMTFDRPATGA